MSNPIYQDVRQWLSRERQRNGGQLAGLDGSPAAAKPLYVAAVALLAIVAILVMSRSGRKGRR